jgi:hypothetical protein
MRVCETKIRRVDLWVADSDAALFPRAAGVADESLSEFLVGEHAERLLAGRMRFGISEK